MLHLWLIPLLAIAVLGIWVLYMSIRKEKGSGERTDGRTVSDKPAPEENRTVEWNVYGE